MDPKTWWIFYGKRRDLGAERSGCLVVLSLAAAAAALAACRPAGAAALCGAIAVALAAAGRRGRPR